MNILLLFLERICESIYFALFLIFGKGIKTKRLLFVIAMTIEYVLLTSIIKYNVWLHFLYTILTYLLLKILYKEKSQITDIFLFAMSSIILILLSIFTYLTALYTYKSYIISLIINRILLFIILFILKDKIYYCYKNFCYLWNRHSIPNKFKSLTVRNISIIIFNIMFCVINFCMIYSKFLN